MICESLYDNTSPIIFKYKSWEFDTRKVKDRRALSVAATPACRREMHSLFIYSASTAQFVCTTFKLHTPGRFLQIPVEKPRSELLFIVFIFRLRRGELINYGGRLNWSSLILSESSTIEKRKLDKRVGIRSALMLFRQTRVLIELKKELSHTHRDSGFKALTRERRRSSRAG